MKKALLEKLTNEGLQYLKDEVTWKLEANGYDARTEEYKLLRMIEDIEYERWCASDEKDNPITVIVR